MKNNKIINKMIELCKEHNSYKIGILCKQEHIQMIKKYIYETAVKNNFNEAIMFATKNSCKIFINNNIISIYDYMGFNARGKKFHKLLLDNNCNVTETFIDEITTSIVPNYNVIGDTVEKHFYKIDVLNDLFDEEDVNNEDVEDTEELMELYEVEEEVEVEDPVEGILLDKIISNIDNTKSQNIDSGNSINDFLRTIGSFDNKKNDKGIEDMNNAPTDTTTNKSIQEVLYSYNIDGEDIYLFDICGCNKDNLKITVLSDNDSTSLRIEGMYKIDRYTKIISISVPVDRNLYDGYKITTENGILYVHLHTREELSNEYFRF